MPTIDIYQGDARELLKTFPTESIDLVFTDPFYNENYNYRGRNFIDYREDYYNFIEDVGSVFVSVSSGF